MQMPWFILAKKNDGGGVFAVVLFVIIWVISVIANAIKKQQQAGARQSPSQRGRQAVRPTAPSVQAKRAAPAQARPVPARLNPAFSRRFPQLAERPSTSPPRMPAKLPPRTARGGMKAPSPVRATVPASQAFAPPPLAAAAPALQATEPAARPRAMRAIVVNASSLQSQFILTEILQAPLALRERRG